MVGIYKSSALVVLSVRSRCELIIVDFARSLLSLAAWLIGAPLTAVSAGISLISLAAKSKWPTRASRESANAIAFGPPFASRPAASVFQNAAVG